MKKLSVLLFVLIGLQSFAEYNEADYDPYYTKNKETPLSLYIGNSGVQPTNIGVGLSFGTSNSVNIVYENIVANVAFETLPIVGGSILPTQIDASLDLIFRLESLTLPIYYGAGVKIKNEEAQKIGVRGVAGIGLFLSDVDENLEVFGEFTPTFYVPVQEGFPFQFEFAVGVRYYI